MDKKELWKRWYAKNGEEHRSKRRIAEAEKKQRIGKRCLDCSTVIKTTSVRCFPCMQSHRSCNKKTPTHCVDCNEVIREDSQNKGVQRCMPCFRKSKRTSTPKHCIDCDTELHRNARWQPVLRCRPCARKYHDKMAAIRHSWYRTSHKNGIKIRWKDVHPDVRLALVEAYHATKKLNELRKDRRGIAYKE